MKLSEVPLHLRQYVKATRSRSDLMGWTPAEVRKAASAAVNGEAPHQLHRGEGTVMREGRTSAEMGKLDPEATLRRHSEGSRLLAALQSRFGDAPGVRVKLGNKAVGWGGLHENERLNDDGWDKVGAQYPEGLSVTAPSTPLAKRFDGFGTGLKPMYEVVIQVRKPLTPVPINGMLAQTQTVLGCALCLLLSPAGVAEVSSMSSQAVPVGASVTAVLLANLATMLLSREASARTVMFSSSEAESVCLSIVSSWSSILAASSGPMRTFTTETETELTTTLRTLNCLLSASIPDEALQAGVQVVGSQWSASDVERALTSASSRQKRTPTTSAAWPATQGMGDTDTPASDVEAPSIPVLRAVASVLSSATGPAKERQPQSSSYANGVAQPSCGLSHYSNPTDPTASAAEAVPVSTSSQVAGTPEQAWVIVAQKPFTGPVRRNCEEWGVGAMNLDTGRIPFRTDDAPKGGFGGMKVGLQHAAQGVTEDYTGEQECNPAGRFAPNLLVSDNALGPRFSRYVSLDSWADAHGLDDETLAAAEAGFCIVPKAGRRERNAGCDGLEAKSVRPAGNEWATTSVFNGENGDEAWRAKNPNNPSQNMHPTCKPLALASYLLHVFCPQGGTVLEPFAGSGTTAVAAVLGGWTFLAAEFEPEYVKIAEARIAWAEQQVAGGRTFRRTQALIPEPRAEAQLTLL